MWRPVPNVLQFNSFLDVPDSYLANGYSTHAIDQFPVENTPFQDHFLNVSTAPDKFVPKYSLNKKVGYGQKNVDIVDINENTVTYSLGLATLGDQKNQLSLTNTDQFRFTSDHIGDLHLGLEEFFSLEEDSLFLFSSLQAEEPAVDPSTQLEVELEEEVNRVIGPIIEDIREIVRISLRKKHWNVSEQFVPNLWSIGSLCVDAIRILNQNFSNQKEVKEKFCEILSQSILPFMTTEYLREEESNEFQKIFTPNNIEQLIRFVLCFPEQEYVHRLSLKLSWGHFLEILKLDDPFAREFYAELSFHHDWKRLSRLTEAVSSMLYHRTVLSRQPEKRIREVLDSLRDGIYKDGEIKYEVRRYVNRKDLYLFPYINLDEQQFDSTKEIEVENLIFEDLWRMRQEFGFGISVIGKQVDLSYENNSGSVNEKRADLFFREGNDLLIIELKKGRFSGSYAGQLNEYQKLATHKTEYFDPKHEKDLPFAILLVTEIDYKLAKLMEKGLQDYQNMFVGVWRGQVSQEFLEDVLRESLGLSEDRVDRDREYLKSLEKEAGVSH